MKTMLRLKVREVLAMAPDYGKTERFIHQSVSSLCGGGVPLQDLRDAIEYNLAERYIHSAFDKESEETLWYITSAGLTRQARP